MNRRRADAMVGLLVVAVLVFGGALWWQSTHRQRGFGQSGSMMSTSMGTVHGPNPLWYVLGTLLLAAVVVGGYLAVRDDLPVSAASDPRPNNGPGEVGPEPADSTASEPGASGEIAPERQPRPRVLDLLPDDERRVLEPVLSSPGITQIALRDRSEFSKSKVSQTVSALEKRGLLYRERQGRTYRVYPSDDLRQTQG